MPYYTFRGNLNAAAYPLVSAFGGRTIINPQMDQNFAKVPGFAGEDADRDIGIPQIFYLHNVVPTGQGMQSVGFREVIDQYTVDANNFDNAFPISDTDQNKGIFVPGAGSNYFFNSNNNAWQSITPFPPGSFPEPGLVTTAQVQGRTFIFYENIGCYEYNFVTNTMNPITLTGLVAANIKGICSSGLYLIAWDGDNALFWGGVTGVTLLNFTPSLSTGAGTSTPNDLKGDIVVVLPMTGGYCIYTNQNAVYGGYTGNIRFPWVWKEIQFAGGVTTPQVVSYETGAGAHYAWTTKGLQKVSRNTAEGIFPECADFFSARIFEDFDPVTEEFTRTYLNSDLFLNLALIGARYLILSYGVNNGLFTHALIYDLNLKRFGKLKLTHTDVFAWNAPNLFGVQTYDDLEGRTYDDLAGTTYDQLSQQQRTSPKPKRDIAFLQQDGTVQILNFDLGNFQTDSVLLIGKFQLIRNRLLTVLDLEIENVDLTNSNFLIKLFTSYDGKNFATKNTLTLKKTREDLQVYGCRVTGQNHTLYFYGAFNLVTYIFSGSNAGDR